MKIKVIDIFRDKFTGEVYSPGTILDFEDEAVYRTWRTVNLPSV